METDGYLEELKPKIKDQVPGMLCLLLHIISNMIVCEKQEWKFYSRNPACSLIGNSYSSLLS